MEVKEKEMMEESVRLKGRLQQKEEFDGGMKFKVVLMFLEWINSFCVVLCKKGLIVPEENGGEGNRGEYVEDWFDVRSFVMNKMRKEADLDQG